MGTCPVLCLVCLCSSQTFAILPVKTTPWTDSSSLWRNVLVTCVLLFPAPEEVSLEDVGVLREQTASPQQDLWPPGMTLGGLVRMLNCLCLLRLFCVVSPALVVSVPWKSLCYLVACFTDKQVSQGDVRGLSDSITQCSTCDMSNWVCHHRQIPIRTHSIAF